MSTRNVESPSVRLATASGGVVRARSSIRSECSALEVQIFWPLIDQPPSTRVAVVWSAVVSDPAVGSVTPNAWSRSSPEAIRRQVPLLLRLGAVPQDRSHRVHLRVARARVAARRVDLLEDHARRSDIEARPAELLGDERREPARLGQRRDELLRVAIGLERTPVLAREPRAQLAHGGADLAELL